MSELDGCQKKYKWLTNKQENIQYSQPSRKCKSNTEIFSWEVGTHVEGHYCEQLTLILTKPKGTFPPVET